MPVTLADYAVATTDSVRRGIIDEFRKSSWILNNIPFDDVANPISGGGAFKHDYYRLKTQPTAATRAINSEYVAQEVEREMASAYTAIMGGAIEIDRVIAEAYGPSNIGREVNFQMSQKVKGVRTYFSELVIKGNKALDPNAFDGLDIALTGASTEYNTGGTATVALDSAANIKSNWEEMRFNLDEWLSSLDRRPDAILGNAKSILRLSQCAQYAGAYSQTKDDWGNGVAQYNGIPLIDIGEGMGSTTPIIGINAGKTDLYAVGFSAVDGLTAITPRGVQFIKAILPQFDRAGAVQKGEVELIAGIAIYTTKSCGVYREAMEVE